MISLDYQIRNALIELQEWADTSTPEDIERFYREGFPYYHPAFSILDAASISNVGVSPQHASTMSGSLLLSVEAKSSFSIPFLHNLVASS